MTRLRSGVPTISKIDIRFQNPLLLLLVLALVATACGPRYVRVVVHEDAGLKIQLRSETREGEAVDRGFAHPAAAEIPRPASSATRRAFSLCQIVRRSTISRSTFVAAMNRRSAD